MKTVRARCLFIVCFLVFVLSTLAILFNIVSTHYLGNNYFPQNAYRLYLILLLMYVGFTLLFGRKNKGAILCKEIFYFLLVLSLVAYATIAVQFTPFTPIDKKITLFENYFHISMLSIINWTSSYPWFYSLLEMVYDTLPYQMSILPLLVIMSGRYDLLREFYFLLVTSVFIGFSIYYFFPTTAPASVLSSPFFTEAQKATGLKFYQIHQQLKPSTLEGGLIALPSFHAIWAWLCLYLIRPWKIAFIFLSIINILLILSCILLGWHYPVDIVASFIILLLCHYLLNRCRK